MGFKDTLKNLMSEEEIVKESSEDKEFSLKEFSKKVLSYSNKDITYYLLLIPVLIFALWIRTRNLHLLDGKYLLGLDPYYFYRLIGEILEHGRLGAIDYMRLPPLGAEQGFSAFSYFLAGWHRFISIFTGQSQMHSHIIYTPIVAIIGFFFFYLLVKEFFGSKTAIVSTALFIVTPAYLYRSMAGFADHEVIAMALLFSAIWLFIKFLKTKKNNFAAISGLLTGCFALIWPGYMLITIPLSLFIITSIGYNSFPKKESKGYFIWVLLFIFPLLLLSRSSLTDIGVLIVFVPLLCSLFYMFLPQNMKIKIPLSKGSLSVILTGIISVIGGIFYILYNPYFITRLLSPAGTARVSLTTSEIIGRVDLWGSFSWIYVLGLFGVFYFIYEIFRESKKYILINGLAVLVSVYLLLIGAFNNSTRIIGFILPIATITFSYFYSYAVTQEKTKLNKIKIYYFMILFLFLMLSYLVKTAARFVFLFAPIICLFAGYALVSISKELYSKKTLRFLTILILLIFLGVFYFNATTTIETARNLGSGYPGQWESSMTWIRNNTPEDSVISHWWDYGYWTQAMGERPSISDGGKPGGSYFIYNLARYGMTAHNETNALTYFKTHGVNYLLYSSEEIGKYHAFSFLASDKIGNNYDRKSTIGTFVMQEEKEVRNGTIRIYQGGWALDQDIVLDNLVLPQEQAFLAGIKLIITNDNQIVDAPEAILVYNNRQFSDNISCISINNQKFTWEVPSNIGGCIILLPYFQSQTQMINQGSLLYMSDKVYPGLFARLYILNEEIEGFEEVYSDQMPLGIFQGRLIGPIRIWELDYPEHIVENPEFLEEPESFVEEYYG